MQEVMVNREELLKILHENREAHREAFEAALESYRARCISELEARLADIKANRTIDVIVRLPVPSDHTSDYDRVIRQCDMSVVQDIVLTDHEFEAYVMDSWDWKQQFTATNAGYGVHR